MRTRPSVKSFHCIPENSYLNGVYNDGDFIDYYSSHGDVTARKALEEIVLFPGWARALMKLRKITTTPFGLSQDGPQDDDKIGAFPVIHDTDNEIVAGFDDKHLNFLVSVQADGETISLATWVRTHGPAGRFYLILIMPFHIMVARNAVRRVATKFPKEI